MVENCIYSLLFDDDHVVIAVDEDEVNYMERKLLEEYLKWSVNINSAKTEYLRVQHT